MPLGGCRDCPGTVLCRPDLAAAYAAVAAKVDLDLPQQSRLVVRLRDEFHNCWSGDCKSDAAELRSQIEAIAAQVAPTPVDPALVLSKALQLGDGWIASGGSRYESNQSPSTNSRR